MSQKKRAAWMIYGLRFLRPLLHILLLLVAFRWAYLLRQQTDLIPGLQLQIPGIHTGDLMVFAVMSIVLFLVFNFSGGVYKLTEPLHGYYTRFFRAWVLWFISMTVLALFGEGFIFVQGISRFIILFVGVTGLFILSLFDMFWNTWNSILESQNPYKILAVYQDQELLDAFLDEFSDYPIYDIRAITIDEYDESRRRDDIDLLVVIGSYDQDLMQTMADHARLQGKSLYHVPESYFLEDLVSTTVRLGPILALEYKSSLLEGWYSVWKRLFDIICSVIAIILLSPIFIIISLIIIIDSRGPVFFVQKRVGKSAKTFSFVKFRSMRTEFCVGDSYGGIEAQRLYRKLIKRRNTRDDILPKIENDPRVTRVGRFLRKTSLDELPNIFCIFLGSMSFVGPRPHLPNEVEKYEPWMRRLFSAKPGMTGYAQIFGRDSLPFREEAKLDLYYIQNRSIAMDLHVLLSTIKVVFAGR